MQVIGSSKTISRDLWVAEVADAGFLQLIDLPFQVNIEADTGALRVYASRSVCCSDLLLVAEAFLTNVLNVVIVVLLFDWWVQSRILWVTVLADHWILPFVDDLVLEDAVNL